MQTKNDNGNLKYKYGFYTNIETEEAPLGLNEETIRFISQKNKEPQFLLNFRLSSYQTWLKMKEPSWANIEYPPIDYQNICYYSAPKNFDKKKSSDNNNIDPQLIETFEKLGIPLDEKKLLNEVAVDAVFDSVSVTTTHQKKLEEYGIIFCSISEAINKVPELIEKYIGKVVNYDDNYFAALNSAVFSDGSFCYIPKGVRCPLDLSTYFRINAYNTGQFERTLIIAEEDSFVNYLEGCTASTKSSYQLHAAVVELMVFKNAEIKYSTVQNWYAGNKQGQGGVYNFVTKRGRCKGENSKISWTQVEAGSAITWKYPSCILEGANSEGSFFSVALTNDYMQADTGTKMIHIGPDTKSTIVAKGISADHSKSTYRGLVKILPSAKNARNYSQCDSLILNKGCEVATIPYIENMNNSSTIEHEATTSKISEEQIFYFQSRGIDLESAISLLVNGFCKEVFKKLPLEFSVEAVKLIETKLEGSIG